MQSCANLVTEEYPVAPTPPPPPAKIVANKTAINTTQKLDATKTAAKVNDKVTYTASVQNVGGTAKSMTYTDNLSDVLKFSKLTDPGGGTFNSATKTLSWPAVTIAPGGKVTHSYTVQMNSSLETTKKDCKMQNKFIDQIVTVPVGCTTPPAKLEVSKTALNVSQGNINAAQTTAKEKDRITFTLTASNKGGTAVDFSFKDDIGDALEYSKLVDKGGATYDEKNRQLVWPTVSLKPGETQVRTFTIQILDAIPATPRGTSDPSSYDCRIENAFYDADIEFPVECATPPKVVERVVTELPQTGPRENMIFAGILLAVVTFFYFRAKQLGTEVRLIRRDVNGGTF